MQGCSWQLKILSLASETDVKSSFQLRDSCKNYRLDVTWCCRPFCRAWSVWQHRTLMYQLVSFLYSCKHGTCKEGRNLLTAVCQLMNACGVMVLWDSKNDVVIWNIFFVYNANAVLISVKMWVPGFICIHTTFDVASNCYDERKLQSPKEALGNFFSQFEPILYAILSVIFKRLSHTRYQNVINVFDVSC